MKLAISYIVAYTKNRSGKKINVKSFHYLRRLTNKRNERKRMREYQSIAFAGISVNQNDRDKFSITGK